VAAVLLHGVGSNAQSLFGLTPRVPPQFPASKRSGG